MSYINSGDYTNRHNQCELSKGEPTPYFKHEPQSMLENP